MAPEVAKVYATSAERLIAVVINRSLEMLEQQDGEDVPEFLPA